jgi:hypothetical protein
MTGAGQNRDNKRHRAQRGSARALDGSGAFLENGEVADYLDGGAAEAVAAFAADEAGVEVRRQGVRRRAGPSGAWNQRWAHSMTVARTGKKSRPFSVRW